MSVTWRHLPKPARAIAEAATGAVRAARSRDAEAFQTEATRLAALDSEQVGNVLGAVVRSLLEELHPDGLTADDVRGLVGHCVRSAAEWFPGVEADVVVILVAGALGLHQSGPEGFTLDGAEVARHAPLLITDLLAASGRSWNEVLAAAFSGIELIEIAETP
ncbi:hypothetical protein DQ384_34930 [Sphaerisporangium album]|uniref:Uncharacterized protein n=1 Tax=Sphaerisporangium album TaxID=509200 RepID=A0A367EZL7_9ACTN|nr:hypothetical protein [Sphaerisporangium album]RCG22847.1 hypothetical protein DQ384_34930 [Sphaerisporangium album]